MVEKDEDVVALIFAAGQSKRMGTQNKLLSKFDGVSLIRAVVNAAIESRCASIFVVTGHEASQVKNELSGVDVIFVDNSQYQAGMASSIVAGVLELKNAGCEKAVMLLGDMPDITGANIDMLIKTSRDMPSDTILISTSSGRRGNPVLWPAQYFDELSLLSGDIGARQVFKKFSENIVEVEIGLAARFDLDTPQAFRDAEKSN